MHWEQLSCQLLLEGKDSYLQPNRYVQCITTQFGLRYELHKTQHAQITSSDQPQFAINGRKDSGGKGKMKPPHC